MERQVDPVAWSGQVPSEQNILLQVLLPAVRRGVSVLSKVRL